MLTPIFSCEQDEKFVMVRMVLSAICKVLEAAFDINGGQFTFHCRPYYLRLKFDQPLQEGRGERATYDLESNTLTVYLPKATEGEVFTQLDNPGYLIATEKQRRTLISVLSGDTAAEATGNEEAEREEKDGEAHAAVEAEEDTEFVQALQLPLGSLDGDAATAQEAVHYGFADHYTGLFARVDEDIVREMVELPDPEHTSAAARRVLRQELENAAFDEEAVLLAFEDADGEVAEVLRYVPAHIADFQRALQSDTVVYARLPRRPRTESDGTAALDSNGALGRAREQLRAEEAGLEEEATTLGEGGSGSVNVWCGNIGEFNRPLIEEVDERGEAGPVAAAQESAAVAAPVAGTRLAVPRQRPQLVFTNAENDALIRVKMPRLLFPPSAESVAALTLDVLLSEAYDDLVTEGQGCSESLWNLTMLSPALSFLDPAASVYAACVAFARCALVYPLHRHFGLVQRVFAVVGTRLLLGRRYTVRALLRVREVLAHSEHKHVLATVFVDPLVAYWMHVADADDHLVRLALELHEHVTRTEAVMVVSKDKAGAGAASLLVTEETRRMLPPINLLTLGLPFEAE